MNRGHLSQSRTAFQSFIPSISTRFLPLTVLLRSANLVAMVAIRRTGEENMNEDGCLRAVVNDFADDFGR
jgi:hypothetical protein